MSRWSVGVLVAAVLGCASAPTVVVPDTEVAARMRADLTYLASPALEGRLTGTPGNDSAAAFIARRYGQLGLQPVFVAACPTAPVCDKSFFEPFRVLGAANRLDVHIRDRTQNVAALVRGTDSALANEYVIVGAHYDHIGPSSIYARDSSPFRLIRLGADDNASGTTSVMELARRFAANPTRRSILFVNFSAEELGLIGSTFFVENAPVPLRDVITMVNLDMVGRLRRDRLVLHTAGAENRFHQVVDSVEKLPPALSFHLIWQPAADEASDQLSFADAHIPVFSPFTELHADYHRAGDIAERINFAGMEKVVDLTERVIRTLADGTGRP